MNTGIKFYSETTQSFSHSTISLSRNDEKLIAVFNYQLYFILYIDSFLIKYYLRFGLLREVENKNTCVMSIIKFILEI